jgi:prepilin-type N-terminal cleavage/methylation domain-containing protein/prepilin-type processing-associated H-X9-DG protein
MMFRNGVRLRRGFTLIELLVVVAIIALLISILLPTLRSARERARQVVCLSILRQVGTSTQYYVNEHYGWYLPHSQLGTPEAPDDPDFWWENYVFRATLGIEKDPARIDSLFYHNVPDDLVCPMATLSVELKVQGYDPLVQELAHMNHSYGYNTWNFKRPPDYENVYRGYRDTHVSRPADKMAFADSLDWDLWAHSPNHEMYPTLGEQYDPTGTQRTGSGIAWRHRFDGEDGEINVCYFDGHASSITNRDAVPLAVLGEPPWQRYEIYNWFWNAADLHPWYLNTIDPP